MHDVHYPNLGSYSDFTSTLLGDRGNVRSSKKPKFAAKYGLYTLDQ